YWLAQPEIPFLTAVQQQVPPLTIGFVTALLPLGEPAPECQQSIAKIVQQLESLGHTLIPQTIDLSSIIEPFKTVWATAVASSGIPPEALSPMNQWVLTQSGTAGEYLQAVTQLQLFARQLVSLFAQIDILVAPTYMHPAIKIGEWADLSPEDTFQRIVNWIFPCPAFNVSGQPVVNIPTGFDSNQVPLGVQLVGKPNSEAIVIALAAQLEQILSWRQLYPQQFG
ncbi:MAG: amidase family protein, partial [Waterburya sp.]